MTINWKLTEKGSCNGDSGGGLFIGTTNVERKLIGIASFASSQGCEKDFPEVYTRVSSFTDWVDKNMAAN